MRQQKNTTKSILVQTTSLLNDGRIFLLYQRFSENRNDRESFEKDSRYIKMTENLFQKILQIQNDWRIF
jgi:hypothetical protein